jgi:GT2 family glycosyltransferase
MRIAVLLATFNRKDKTIACLDSLYGQILPEGVTLEVILTDDASSDGTVLALKIQFPAVRILNGSGVLFWAGGMRNSWTEALKSDPDYYLLLNDDTILVNNAISKLLAYDQNGSETGIIRVGTTKDSASGEISYGGRKLYHQGKIQSYPVFSEDAYLECDLANANILLVPKVVVAAIGILSADYTHSIADFDYTLRAKKAGFKTIVVAGILGYCTDDHGNNWQSAKVPLKDRIKYLKSPKGLAYGEYLTFIRRHFPMHLPAAFFKLWMKTLFPVLWDKLKK